MRNFITYLGCTLIMSTAIVKAQNFEIKLGNAILSGTLPDNRTSSAPDIPYIRSVNVCDWENLKGKSKKFNSLELTRKLWEFKRFLRTPSGSLVFTISVFNNEKFGLDYKAYFDWLHQAIVEDIQKIKDSGYINSNYTPPDDYNVFEKDGQNWLSYTSNNGNIRSYLLALDNHVMLRFNLRQSDNRKEAELNKWHPKAETLAKIITESIHLGYPENGKLCDCID